MNNSKPKTESRQDPENLPPIPENSKKTGKAVDSELSTENLKNLLKIAIRKHDDEAVESINALLDDRNETDLFSAAFDPKKGFRCRTLRRMLRPTRAGWRSG